MVKHYLQSTTVNCFYLIQRLSVSDEHTKMINPVSYCTLQLLMFNTEQMYCPEASMHTKKAKHPSLSQSRDNISTAFQRRQKVHYETGRGVSDADEHSVLCLCSSAHYMLCWACAYTECKTLKQWLLIIKNQYTIHCTLCILTFNTFTNAAGWLKKPLLVKHRATCGVSADNHVEKRDHKQPCTDVYWTSNCHRNTALVTLHADHPEQRQRSMSVWGFECLFQLKRYEW